jgi:hypothetical protein
MFGNPPLAVDVVVCDAAIGEMDPFAARYIIRLAKSFLEKSDIGVFLYQNLGEQRQNTSATVNHLFTNVNGYRSFTCGPVTMQCANASLPDDVVSKLSDGPPRVNHAPGEPLSTAETFINVHSSRLMESYAFFDYLRLDLG